MNKIAGFSLSVVVSMSLLGLVSAAGAADLPKRKAGLWEISSQVSGAPNYGAIQQCIDANTDNLMQQRAKAEKVEHKCSVQDVTRQGNKVTIHSVCALDKTVVTTDAVITGNFDSGYHSDMKMRYNPPMYGMSESTMTQDAKWLGPCKPGQKPGDIMMPGMAKFNMQDMEKQRKAMQEMMKQKRGE